MARCDARGGRCFVVELPLCVDQAATLATLRKSARGKILIVPGTGINPGLIAERMARGACVLFGADLGVATTGYAEPSDQWQVAEPFGWWGLARLLPGGDYAVASGRVDCPGLARVDVQERVAGAALDALLGWIRGPAAERTT